MNINLANIDFAPGQGGGGEAVIRTLDVTENGTYRAPSGVNGYNPVNVNVSAGGSVTPEEQEALDILVNQNNEDGALYTDVFKPLVNFTRNTVNIPNSGWVYRQFYVGDDLYCAGEYNQIYKYAPDKYTYELYNDRFKSSIGDQPLWSDMTGRVYYGQNFVVNLDTAEVTDIDLRCSYYTYRIYGLRKNFWKGKYGVYQLSSTPQKFDETNQYFVDWNNVHITSDYDLSEIPAYFGLFGFDYDGRHLMVYTNNTIWELKEYEDHIDIELLNNPPIPELPDELVGSECSFISTKSGELYVFVGDYRYRLVNGNWVSFDIYDINGNYAGQYVEYPGIAYGDFLIGYGETNDMRIMNMGDTAIKYTYWSEPKNFAVDIYSDQQIIGSKSFYNGVMAPGITLDSISSRGGSTDFRIGKNDTVADSIQINCPDARLNDNPVATTNLLILNRTYSTYGKYIGPKYTSSLVGDVSYNNYFKTYTGRIFYSQNEDWREWNGTNWNTSYSRNMSVYNNGGTVVAAPNNTFYNSSDGYTYLWDDSNTNFVQLCANVGSDGYMYWWDGSRLRCSDFYLENDNNNWKWVQEVIPDYKSGMHYYLNNKVYCLGFDSIVYEFNAGELTYTAIGSYPFFTQYSFISGGDIIFPSSDNKFKKIDFSKVNNNEIVDISRDTEIPYYPSNFHYDYNGRLFFGLGEGEFAYCYDMDEELPVPDVGDGTYVLKATVLNGNIHYEWILDN